MISPRTLCLSMMMLVAGLPLRAVETNADSVVIESLSSPDRFSSLERSLRRQLAAQPLRIDTAVALSKLLIDRSRMQGDPRHAGQALAVLSRWPEAVTAPIEVLMQRADAQQHLHDFKAARLNLEQLVKRDARHAQAWLSLATLHRLQGRYSDSNQACAVLSRLNQSVYANACLAENWGLMGQTKKSRDTLQQLISDDSVLDEQRAWLLTTLAELEARCRQYAAADKSYRAALRLSPRDSYLAVSYADFLLSRGRAPEALSLLKEHARSDAVLLRQVRARLDLNESGAVSDLEELSQRMSQEKLSAQERLGHAREHAMFELWIRRDSTRALELARLNLTVQREPVDLLLFAQAAQASKQRGAVKEVIQLKKDMGLFDERIDELL